MTGAPSATYCVRMTRVRTRTILLSAMALGAAIALTTPATAFAATIDQWNGGSDDSWSTASNWASATAPVSGTGQTLEFLSPTASLRSENTISANFGLRAAVLSVPDFLLAGSSLHFQATDPADGIIVNAEGTVTMNLDMTNDGDQAWLVGQTSTLLVPSWVTILSGTTYFEVYGTTEISGRLDGNGGAGGAVMFGGGTLILSGQGGAIKDGLQVPRGTVHVPGFLAGTAFAVTGGTLSGNGTLDQLRLDSGTLSPGATAGGTDVATLDIWNGLTTNAPGAIALQLDGTTSDVIAVYRDVTLNGSPLQLSLAGSPAVGTSYPVITSDIGVLTGTLSDRAGTPLAEGAEFADSGQRFSISYLNNAVTLTYLGPVPTPAAPSAAEPAALPGTGADGAFLLGSALLLGAAGLAMMLLRSGRRLS